MVGSPSPIEPWWRRYEHSQDPTEQPRRGHDDEAVSPTTPWNPENLAITIGHEIERTLHEQPVGETLESPADHSASHEVSGDRSIITEAQFGREVKNREFELRYIGWRIDHSHISGQRRHLGDVLVGFVAGDGVATEALVRPQEHGNLSRVHPGEQVRVVRAVRDAVVGDASNAFVNGEYLLDGVVRAGSGAVGRVTDKVRRLQQAAEGISLIARVLSNPRHCVRMEHLEEE